MGKPHDVPLSEQALRILGDQMGGRGKNQFVFPGRPRQPLSHDDDGDAVATHGNRRHRPWL